MAFKENLKAQLRYLGLQVKELAELTGIKKPTLDSYLRSNSYTPSVEAGVKIARALGVSAESLVLGTDAAPPPRRPVFNSEDRAILDLMKELRPHDRLKLIEIAKVLRT